MTTRIVKWIVAIILIFVIAFPIYWILISSFKPSDQILIPDLWPRSWTLRHYYELITQTGYLAALRASIILAVGTMVSVLVVVVSSSYAIYRMDFRGKELIQRVILVTYIFPGILLVVPIYNIMAYVGLVDSILAVAIVNVTFIAPFSVWLMRGFYKAIPETLDESSSLDGAGPLRILFFIIMPLLKPGIATVAIYSFIMSWTEFVFSSVLLMSEVNRTLPIVMQGIMGQYTVRWGHTSAGAVLMILPVVLLFAFVGKYFIKGLTEGAVKE